MKPLDVLLSELWVEARQAADNGDSAHMSAILRTIVAGWFPGQTAETVAEICMRKDVDGWAPTEADDA